MIQPGHRTGLAPPNAGRKWPPELLAPAEARRLLGSTLAARADGDPQPRADRGAGRGGLRVSEALALALALALAPRDIDAGACALAVRHGKGDRHRTVEMDPAAFSEGGYPVAQRRLTITDGDVS